MPARIFVVHDDPALRANIISALHEIGPDIVSLDDPMRALALIEKSGDLRLLVTRIDFGKGRLNGVALARMVNYRQSGVHTVFIGRSENERYAAGVGEFLALPLDRAALVNAVSRLLVEEEQA